MYYARVAIARELQALYPTEAGSNKKELWKSLGTHDPKQAASKVRPVLARWEAEFERLRTCRQPTPADLSKDIEQAASTLTVKAEAAGEVTLEDAGNSLTVRDAAQWSREQRERHLETLRLHLARGETALDRMGR